MERGYYELNHVLEIYMKSSCTKYRMGTCSECDCICLEVIFREVLLKIDQESGS